MLRGAGKDRLGGEQYAKCTMRSIAAGAAREACKLASDSRYGMSSALMIRLAACPVNSLLRLLDKECLFSSRGKVEHPNHLECKSPSNDFELARLCDASMN